MIIYMISYYIVFFLANHDRRPGSIFVANSTGALRFFFLMGSRIAKHCWLAPVIYYITHFNP